MKKYAITPAEIRVKQGDNIELLISSDDVQHGFDVPGLGVKESIQPGKPAVVAFMPEKKGEFSIECGIICGPRHDEMRGKLIVE